MSIIDDWNHRFYDAFRFVCRMPPARITPTRAIEIAHDEAIRLGIPWGEPFWIEEDLWAIHITTNVDGRGGNSVIWVDVWTGTIIGAGVIPY